MKIPSDHRVTLRYEQAIRAIQQADPVKELGITETSEVVIETPQSPDEANAAIEGLSEPAFVANVQGVTLEISKEAMKDPYAMRFLEHMGKAAEANRKSLEKPSPLTVAMRTGGGATIGLATGVGVGVAIGIIKNVGQGSGNPFLGALALACGLAGAGIGAGFGSGLIGKVTTEVFTLESQA